MKFYLLFCMQSAHKRTEHCLLKSLKTTQLQAPIRVKNLQKYEKKSQVFSLQTIVEKTVEPCTFLLALCTPMTHTLILIIEKEKRCLLKIYKHILVSINIFFFSTGFDVIAMFCLNYPNKINILNSFFSVFIGNISKY